jgi:hypothetical protein
MASRKKPKIHQEAIQALLRKEPGIRGHLTSLGNSIANEARATASDAENGAGGKIDGYSAAGFSVEWESRARRPRVVVKSNASGEISLAAHFNSQRKNGLGHLRAALQSVFPMKRFKQWSKGRPFSTQYGQSRSNQGK